MRSQLCLDWYLGLDVSKAQGAIVVEKSWVGALSRILTPVGCPVSEVTVTAASSLIRLGRHSLVLSCKRLDFASPGSSSWDRRENSL